MPGAGCGFGVRSRLSTAFRSDWELMWPYRFAMSATVPLAHPSSSPIAISDVPASRSRVTALWRKSWKRTGTLASVLARRHVRLILPIGFVGSVS